MVCAAPAVITPGTGRKDRAPRLDKSGRTANRNPDLEMTIETPDGGMMDDLGLARPHLANELGARPIVGAELVARRDRC
jgi:hypothetical protein